jgi:hypothetical protein
MVVLSGCGVGEPSSIAEVFKKIRFGSALVYFLAFIRCGGEPASVGNRCMSCQW